MAPLFCFSILMLSEFRMIMEDFWPITTNFTTLQIPLFPGKHDLSHSFLGSVPNFVLPQMDSNICDFRGILSTSS